MAETRLRAMRPDDWPAVAALIHTSTNAWYEAHGRAPVFGCEPAEVGLFCRVYEALDPGCCVLAEAEDGRLLGSCFYHPRPTHVALGIMNTHPDAFGHGVARQLLAFIVDFAEQCQLPVRLVSSAMNLDSFSLYNRAGFRPIAVFQDMILEVPAEGLPSDARVRDATPDDVDAIVALERELAGIERAKDYAYVIENQLGIWQVKVMDGDAGLDGFLVSVADPASDMLGPGVMRDDDTALALIKAQLDSQPGRTKVWLVQSDRPGLVAGCYALGARNCEIHLAQVRGEATAITGVVMPTFMPETG